MNKAKKIAYWYIPLIGHTFDLEDFPFWLSDQSIHVTSYKENYVIAIPTSIVGEDYKPVRELAEQQVDLMNGIGKLLSPSFRSISLSDKLFGVDSSCNIISTVVALGFAETRCKAGNIQCIIGNKVQPDSREAAADPLIKAALSSMKAHDAIVIAGRTNLTWSELYLLFELVKSEANEDIYNFGWITKSDAKKFTGTANSYKILGIHGRHGKDQGDPPKKTMKYNEAVKLIHNLSKSWLTYIGNQQ